jgi:hypothetical protein
LHEHTTPQAILSVMATMNLQRCLATWAGLTLENRVKRLISLLLMLIRLS